MIQSHLCRARLAESNPAPQDRAGDTPLTFLPYNLNHSSTLAGISTLLRSLSSTSSPAFPSIIFIQECLLSQGRLDALVRPLGYVSVLAAAAEGTERRLVCLYWAGLEVTSVDLEPGFVQAVTVGWHSVCACSPGHRLIWDCRPGAFCGNCHRPFSCFSVFVAHPGRRFQLCHGPTGHRGQL